MREALKLSVPALAALVSKELSGEKVSYQALQQLEGGDSRGTRYLVPLARALKRSPDWLYDESGPEIVDRQPEEALLVGYVGAGDEVFRSHEQTPLEGIAPPPGFGACNAARIRGTSQHPLQDGWIVFYGEENQGVQMECLGKLCVAQVKDDGPTLLKTVRRGSKRGHYNLMSWNAPIRKDVPLAWAARVIDIRPT